MIAYVNKGNGEYIATARLENDGEVCNTRTFAHLEQRSSFEGKHVSSVDAAITWCFCQGATRVDVTETYQPGDWPYSAMVRQFRNDADALAKKYFPAPNNEEGGE